LEVGHNNVVGILDQLESHVERRDGVRILDQVVDDWDRLLKHRQIVENAPHSLLVGLLPLQAVDLDHVGQLVHLQPLVSCSNVGDGSGELLHFFLHIFEIDEGLVEEIEVLQDGALHIVVHDGQVFGMELQLGPHLLLWQFQQLLIQGKPLVVEVSRHGHYLVEGRQELLRVRTQITGPVASDGHRLLYPLLLFKGAVLEILSGMLIRRLEVVREVPGSDLGDLVAVRNLLLGELAVLVFLLGALL